MSRLVLLRQERRTLHYELVVTNDQDRPVRFEAEFYAQGRFRPAVRLGRRDGRPLWQTTVPANGSATLRLRYRPGER